MKTVLIITDVFPPLAGAGIKRILKFTKFLPEHGWRCFVLTADNERFLPTDPTLLREVPPATTVVRTYTLESLMQKSDGMANPSSAGPGGRTRRVPLRRRLYKFFGRFLRMPDSRILWLPSAVARGVRLCRQYKINVLLASGPSFTNFLVGACIKILSRRPLVLDVRDAWVADPTRQFEKEYLRRMDAWCERFVLRRANRVITTNPFVTSDFADRYRHNPSTVFDTIYNGFDRDDFTFAGNAPSPTPDRFTIVHAGRLYAERTPRFFLEALSMAFQENPAMRDKTTIRFVGSCETYLDGKRIEDYVRELGLDGTVELVGRVSRTRSLEYQMQAHLLLLIIGIVPPAMALTYGISGKLFDYAACERPILTLANEGATRELIVTHRLGDVFFHEDLPAIRDYLVHAFQQFTDGVNPGGPDARSLQEFDFRSLAGRMSQHLDMEINP